MICKFCDREIPEQSIFCNWCGEKQLRQRKRRETVSVPEPRQLPSGSWNIWLGTEKQSVTEATAALCKSRAQAIRAGWIKTHRRTGRTLGQLMDSFMDEREHTLSPSTIVGYSVIRRHRFKSVMDTMPASSVSSWQQVVDDEAALGITAKTVKNAWCFTAEVLRLNKIDYGDVTLPAVSMRDMPWLDYEQIPVFVEHLRGKFVEVPALIALHSLRRSEICALTYSKFDPDKETLKVEGSVVLGRDGQLHERSANKTDAGRRVVKIVIPRLLELLKENLPADPDQKICTCALPTMGKAINRVCREAGLPEVGVHGLRRSFASLAYHLGWTERATMEAGGWKDPQIVHRVYIKLAAADKQKHYDDMTDFYAGKDQQSAAENGASGGAEQLNSLNERLNEVLNILKNKEI